MVAVVGELEGPQTRHAKTTSEQGVRNGWSFNVKQAQVKKKVVKKEVKETKSLGSIHTGGSLREEVLGSL